MIGIEPKGYLCGYMPEKRGLTRKTLSPAHGPHWSDTSKILN